MGRSSWIEIIYWGSTIIGGTLFLLRTIMMLFGGVVDHDYDESFESADEMEIDSDSDTDVSFKLLTLQGVTAFFMMFGLVGLSLLKANITVSLTIVGGIAAGLFSVWVISLLFSKMRLLQSDGTMNIQNAIGQKGTVYLSIPNNGSGQVQVTVQGSLRVLNAISKDGQNIPYGEKIIVIDAVDNNALIVEKQ